MHLCNDVNIFNTRHTKNSMYRKRSQKAKSSAGKYESDCVTNTIRELGGAISVGCPGDRGHCKLRYLDNRVFYFIPIIP